MPRENTQKKSNGNDSLPQGQLGAVARRVAIDMPKLMLLGQAGEEQHGWRGTPVYWPVIVAQQNIRTAIFAHETAP